MDVQDIRDRKTELTMSIIKLVNAFEKETDVTIRDIKITRTHIASTASAFANTYNRLSSLTVETVID